MAWDSNLTPSAEEITIIVEEEIRKSGKRADFDNFLLIFKKKQFEFYPYFKHVQDYIQKYHLYKKTLFQYMLKMEVAENMLLEGANEREIKEQTNIPNELFSLIIKKYYLKIPLEIVQMKLIHFRILQLTKHMHSFYKHVLEKYTPEDKKDLINTFYQSMIDMSSLSEKQSSSFNLSNKNIGQ